MSWKNLVWVMGDMNMPSWENMAMGQLTWTYLQEYLEELDDGKDSLLSAQIFWRVITHLWNAVAFSTGRLPAQGRMPLPCSVSYSRLYYRKLKVTYKKDTQRTICYIFFFFLHWVMDYIEGYGKQSITIWTKQNKWQVETMENDKKKKRPENSYS